MLSTEQMKSLKQQNVSEDIEKSKVRFSEDFTATTAAQKRALTDTSGQGQGSFRRVFEYGTPNARLVISMAQVLNVNPFYYTGEADEKSECTSDLIKQFLSAKGYSDLVSNLETPA